MPERLLIIEDEDTLCESLRRVFQREGYEVDIAFDAESALDLARDKSYDLVITDVILPGISGIEFMKRYREKKPGAKVIVMTAYSSTVTADDAMNAGACDYLIKPIMHNEIKQAVRKALGHEPDST